MHLNEKCTSKQYKQNANYIVQYCVNRPLKFFFISIKMYLSKIFYTKELFHIEKILIKQELLLTTR